MDAAHNSSVIIRTQEIKSHIHPFLQIQTIPILIYHKQSVQGRHIPGTKSN